MSSFAARPTSREVRHFALSSLCAAIAAVAGAPAWAACDDTAAGGTDVICDSTDPLQPNYASALDEVSIRVNQGVTLSASQSGMLNPLDLSGTGTSVTNYGSINPQASGSLSSVPSMAGVTMQSDTASTKSLFNYQAGTISNAYNSATSPSTAAVVIHNQRAGNQGRTTIFNGGTISARPRVGVTGIADADAIAVAATGGAQVLVTNNGTIIGRVGLGGSAPGNTFTNGGTIIGSVSLGATGGNRFVAKTGSSVESGGGTASSYTTTVGAGAHRIDFAAAGKVDGGAAGNNTLELSAGTGTDGAIALGNFVNFDKLNVDSGAWTLSGSMPNVTETTLRGTAIITDSAALGDASTSVRGTGGTLINGSTFFPLDLTQDIDLQTGGLTFGEGTFTVNGQVSGTGQLTRTGSGTLYLYKANFYSGGTLLQNSNLYVFTNRSIGTGALTAAGDASLDVLSGLNVDNALTLNAASNLEVRSTGDFSLSGPISGTGVFTKAGAGTTTLLGDMTSTGGVVVASGTLRVEGAGRLSSTAPVSLTSSTSILDLSQAVAAPTLSNLSGTGGAEVRAGVHRLSVDSTSSSTFGGRITGTGGLLKLGTGTLTLLDTQAYTGGTVIRGGTLALSGVGSLTPGQPVTLDGAGAALDLTAAGGAREIGALSGVAGSTLRLGANNLIVNQADPATFAGTSTGTGSIVKRGAGTLTLSGANATGGLVIDNGDVTLAPGGSLSASTRVAINRGTSTLDLSAPGARTLNALSGVSGSRVLIGANTLYFGGHTQETFAGVISGTGSISTSGRVLLSGANEHTGGTTVGDGVLTAGADNVLGTGAFGVATLSTFDMNGTTQTVGSLSGAGNITNIGLLTVGDDNAPALFSGSFAGAGDLVKTGSNRLTLNGLSTAHTGQIRVAGGELRVIGVTSSDVRVQAGAQLTGSGVVGSATLEAGGTLQLGTSSGLSVTRDLSVASGATVAYTLGQAPTTLRPDLGTAPTVVGGNVTLNGTFDLLNPANHTGLGYYRVLRYDGTRTGTLQMGTIAPGLSGPASLIYDVPNVIDLRIGVGGAETLQQWAGGTTWSTTGTNWFNDGGTIPIDWQGNHAAFTTAGGGNVAVAGTQSFAGLQFTTSGYTLGGTGTLETKPAGSEIRVLADESATIGTVISGTGGIDKTEGGKLTLTGTNTYAGSTVLSGGTLSVARDSNLGDPAAALRFAGGTLEITGTTFTSIARPIEWTAAGGTVNIADPANTFTIGQPLSGTGDLVKSGLGTLRLSGTQAYGNTRVTEGTLIGDAASIRGDLVNAGTVVFEQDLPGTFAGSVTNTGTLQKAGAGVLTLTGTSSGNWDLLQGMLVADAGRFQGNVSIDPVGLLRFEQTGTATYAGQISGAGNFSKTGSGAVTLTGDSSAFAGNTRVEAGRLNVGTSAGGALGGTITVASGGTLGGSGTVGTTVLLDGARIAPGNSIGTLTVAGDLTFAPKSVYEVEADPDSSDSDRIDVTGHTTLDGSVLHVGAGGDFGVRREYTILTSGTLAGQFKTVQSNFAYLVPKLDYEAQRVALSLERKTIPVDPVNPVDPVDPPPAPPPPEPPLPGEPAQPVPPPAPTRPIVFADLAQTRNQRAVATALETLPAGSALHDFVLLLPEGAPPAVFNSLTGEAHAGVTGSLSQGAAQPRNLSFSKLRANLDAGLRPGAPTAAAGVSDSAPSASVLPGSNAQPAWAEVFGNWRTQDRTGNTASTRERTGGVFVGADHAVGVGWRAGAALGYTDSHIDTRERASRADVSSYTAMLYGGRSFEAGPGAWKLMLGAGYTWHDISTERNALSQTAKLESEYGASTTQLFTELGYRWDATARTTLEPFVGVAWSDLRSRAFSESGGAAALSGSATRTTQTTTTLGLRGTQDVDVGTLAGRLSAMLGWRHLFGDVTPTSRLAFEGSQAFTVAGAPIARDAAVLELGADLAVGRATTLGVSYTGQLAKDSREHGAQVNLRWRF
ncbi:hypothetical protein CEK29_12535 [Bordetella genomosp. 5]|uniref:autotransporter domain-containing protein n=1 Tax=Bordetella genomosp. 5 TaxID=1395608 RepID=UPI000B9EEC7A|nr:autotransporter domain-containing protein [Bordetella genomosp. 5]OZI42565.1 hypothetical protein CEK29_12535 [Bordetella genomosp. 5]